MSGHVYVLYCEHNDYYQHGPTAERFWKDEPSIKILNKILDTNFPEDSSLDAYNEYLNSDEVSRHFNHDTYFVSKEEME